jgi:hypothetical protein
MVAARRRIKRLPTGHDSRSRGRGVHGRDKGGGFAPVRSAGIQGGFSDTTPPKPLCLAQWSWVTSAGTENLPPAS